MDKDIYLNLKEANHFKKCLTRERKNKKYNRHKCRYFYKIKGESRYIISSKYPENVGQKGTVYVIYKNKKIIDKFKIEEDNDDSSSGFDEKVQKMLDSKNTGNVKNQMKELLTKLSEIEERLKK